MVVVKATYVYIEETEPSARAPLYIMLYLNGHKVWDFTRRFVNVLINELLIPAEADCTTPRGVQ